MFRRRWSGLPADPIFPSDLAELGYFINEIDEIRSIENPDYYFKYFLTKNERWNERQRFAFDEAIGKIIHARLDAAGFTSVPLPIGTAPEQPHVPIRTSPALAAKKRVVVLFGESAQQFGVFAHRVIGGKGGVERGSVLSLVRALKGQRSSAAEAAPPGLVVANPGELWWWPEGGRGLTPTARHAVPMSSAVQYGRYHDARANEIPGNKTVAEHVRSVFEAVLTGGLVATEAKLDVIAVADVADEVEEYLNDEAVWGKVGPRMNCLVVLGGFYSSAQFKCEGFARFMKERARAYVLHETPLDNPIAGPSGNPGERCFTSYGCPVYSAGDAQYVETLLIETQPAVLKWIQKVALEGEAYTNEEFEIYSENNMQDIDAPWAPPESADEGGKTTEKEIEGDVRQEKLTTEGKAEAEKDSGVEAKTEGEATAEEGETKADDGGGDTRAVKAGGDELEPNPAIGDPETDMQELMKGIENLQIKG